MKTDEIPMATVDYSLSRTLNMGNFESTKITVGLSLECEATKEEIMRAFGRAKHFVDGEIMKQEHEWKVGGES